jgi:hypothetical protein
MVTRSRPSRPYGIWLCVLLLLFAVRVVAQPLALAIDSPLLPSFESWHSGALPYGLLLASQIALLFVLGRTASQFMNGGVNPRRTIGIVALAFGAVYFAGSAARLILGFTALSHLRWFASPIPTVFHLVLAAFLLLFGRFHYVYGAQFRPGR